MSILVATSLKGILVGLSWVGLSRTMGFINVPICIQVSIDSKQVVFFPDDDTFPHHSAPPPKGDFITAHCTIVQFSIVCGL